ncbi:Heterochromatin-associated protein MENT [Hypsibius exemplaris]|uniref:Heterochromatin-associated protein MENT n=1 Tax=Hypsibius exemplaris TaxID=2072580 RepID=A0A1W0X015_HYPEX|nr:Heterochromatin-associated protein MENT [Hypsibius exemplaris]
MEQASLSLQSVQAVCDNATVNLYSAAAGFQTNGNLLISPLSIVYASLLLYLGSQGETRRNLDNALHFSDRLGPVNVTPAFSEALALLKVPASLAAVSNATKTTATTRTVRARHQKVLPGGPEDSPSFQLALANGVFVEESYALNPNYLSNVTKFLRASVVPEKFVKDSEASRKDINNWVDARTGGKIKDILPTGSVDVSTKAVLVNAVYFKSSWETAFKTTQTKKGDFNLLTAGRKLGLQYLELPYADYEASLLVLLPRKTAGLRDLEKALSADLLGRLAGDADDSQIINVTLPRFKTGSAFDLTRLLQKIGVNDVFTMNADLSGMAPEGDLLVSSAVHKTFIDVNEKGTEAAAASALVISTKMAMVQMKPLVPPISFNVDHPFVYAIRHNPTRLIVFIGRVETF